MFYVMVFAHFWSLILCFHHVLSFLELNTTDTSPFHINKIRGCKRARPGDVPYQVQILRWSKFHCCGALVIVEGKQIVLTAASCIVAASTSNIEIIAGDINNSEVSLENQSQRRKVSRIVVHDDYTIWNSFENDIAILEVSRPFRLNNNVWPIDLPKQDQKCHGIMEVSGWGFGNGPNSRYLRKSRVQVISDKKCQNLIPGGEELFVPAMMMCTRPSTRNVSCLDTGSPLRSLEGNYLAGIRCGQIGYTGIHTKVSYFTQWIEEEVTEWFRYLREED